MWVFVVRLCPNPDRDGAPRLLSIGPAMRDCCDLLIIEKCGEAATLLRREAKLEAE